MVERATGEDGGKRFQGNHLRRPVELETMKTRRRNANWQMTRVVDSFQPKMRVWPLSTT
jgi:hypothetical protein